MHKLKKSESIQTGSKKKLLDRLNRAMVDKVPVQSERTLKAPTQEAVTLATAKYVLMSLMEEEQIDQLNKVFHNPMLAAKLANLI